MFFGKSLGIKEIVNLLNEVIDVVEKCKDILACEVDTEWCFDGKTLYFVQARAITDVFANKQE